MVQGLGIGEKIHPPPYFQLILKLRVGGRQGLISFLRESTYNLSIIFLALKYTQPRVIRENQVLTESLKVLYW